MGHSTHTMSIQPGYLLMERSEGYEVVWSEQPAMLEEISAACSKAGCRKVLILGPSTKVRLSATDLFELGQAIAKLGLQIAIVERHDTSTENVEFLETVTHNRGGAIQFFVHEQDAKEWLGVE